MSADATMPGDHLRTPFGQLLRSLRMRALLSQEQLAQRSSLGVRTIRDLEGGRVSCPRGQSVQLLAAALGLGGEARQRFELAARMPRVASVAARQQVEPAAVAPPDKPPAPAGGYGGWPAESHEYVNIPRQATRPASTGWAVPAQLPMDTPVFAGRDAELARLDALLDRADGSTVVVAAVWGGPGVGKTTLAVHWAHQVCERFPDGQLYVDLCGFARRGPLSSSQAICSLLGALGVPADRMPSDLHAQACLYRSLLNGRRVLILLDNARNVEQVRPLLPGAPGSLVVVTSRRQLTGLIAVEGASPLTLGLLTMSEARELMACRLGRDRVLAEPAAVDEIIDRCARLPLAMAVFTSRMAAGPNFPLTTRAAELRDASEGLDSFGGDASSDVRTSFSLSYNALSAEAARLFRLFGRYRAVDLAPAAAGVLAGLPERQVRVAFDELSRAHLAVERRPGYFATHKLLRAYAAELADLVDTTVSQSVDAASTVLKVPSVAGPVVSN